MLKTFTAQRKRVDIRLTVALTSLIQRIERNVVNSPELCDQIAEALIDNPWCFHLLWRSSGQNNEIIVTRERISKSAAENL